MKKQSARARAQQTSVPPVRHQLEHEVPTVIHHPEEDMTALARWAHHAMLEPRRYLTGPLALIGGLLLVVLALRLLGGRSTTEAELWKKLETAKSPAERLEIARTDPSSPAATWAKLQAGTEFYNQALADIPNNRDVALPTSKKALDLFDEVAREAPHDSPQARVAALGKARVLEMRNELDKAIEQYKVVARDWPDTPEGKEAAQLAEDLKDPQAIQFYKELYAYAPTKVTLPPGGQVTLPLPGDPGKAAPKSEATGPATAPEQPVLSPDISAIPGVREVIEPKAGKAAAPATKPEGAAKAKEKELPADVFAPKAGESKPK